LEIKIIINFYFHGGFMVYLFYALVANLCFSSSSLVFANFTTTHSASWLNLSKAFIAAISFLVTVLFFSLWIKANLESYVLWSISGVLGLAIGDYFLMNSFAMIGPARALMLDSFQPLLMGILSYYFLNQVMTLYKLSALIFLVFCVLIFAHENYSNSGSWNFKGISYALIGTSLEGISMLVARLGFDKTPTASPFMGNFIRSTFAFIILYIVGKKLDLKFVKTFKEISLAKKMQLSAACFIGTYISLSFNLKAIQVGNLAVVSAIAITSPMFASILEIVFNKQKITKHFIYGTSCFLVGALVLIFT
jgi:drug/metabolite transporter (DMT)-like permease